MRHQRSITLVALIAVLAALAAPGPAAADDRNFMSQAAAPPNLIFILDTSSSMVLSPEVTDDGGDPPVATPLNGALLTSANVPGAGDDPYSRMGIAKRVLRDFLNDIGDANVVLAGYAQAETTDPSPNDLSVPTKHWVYEARAQDRFHMIEATYAYRFGYSLDHTNSILLDNPGDIYSKAMIGYKLYFDPASTGPTERFGPVNAYDSGYEETLPDDTTVRLPYDLMPIYFGNCFVDDKGTPADDTDDTFRCWDSAEEDVEVRGTMTFPFINSGARYLGGTLLSERYYYGDPSTQTSPNCDPSITPTADNPDDGCLAEWNETAGTNIIVHKRRVQLMIPPEISGQPNHFLADDGSGTLVGNYLDTSDSPGNDNYDGDATADADYDEAVAVAADPFPDVRHLIDVGRRKTRQGHPPEHVRAGPLAL